MKVFWFKHPFNKKISWHGEGKRKDNKNYEREKGKRRHPQ